MSEQFSAIVVAMVGAAAVILVVGAVLKRARRLSGERAMRATERGWIYTQASKSGPAYAVEGSADGFKWRLVVKAGQKGHTSAEWRSEELATGGAVVGVMSRAAAALFKSPLATKAAQWGMSLVPAGDPRAQAFERLLEGSVGVDTGDGDFQKVFGVLATDEGEARRLLTPEVRRALLEWHGTTRRKAGGGSLTVTWSGAGVSVSWGTGLEEPDAMVRFAEMGLLIGRALKPGW